MSTEYFVDKISNINVQGSVISFDLNRIVRTKQGADTDSFALEKRLTVTMTGNNFISFVKNLNHSVKAISDQKNKLPEQEKTQKP